MVQMNVSQGHLFQHLRMDLLKRRSLVALLVAAQFARQQIVHLRVGGLHDLELGVAHVHHVALQLFQNGLDEMLFVLARVIPLHEALAHLIRHRSHLHRQKGLHVQIVRQRIGLERLDLLPNLQQHVMLLVKLRSQLETKLLVAFQVAPNRFIALIYPIQAIFRLLHDRVLLIHQFVD